VLDNFSYVNNQSVIESYSYSAIAHSPSLKNKIKIDDDEPLIGMVQRGKFDFELVKLAKEKGSFLMEGKSVVDLKILKDRVTLILDDGSEIESEILIGADGIWSLIAKKTDLRTGPIDYAICILKEFELDEKTLDKFFKKSRVAHIHTSFQDIKGYGWIFPKKKHLNIGIGEFIFQDEERSKHNLSDVFKNYIKILKREKIIPDSVEIGKCKGGAIPINTLKKTYSNRVVLIGDAAGFVCPTSGEGIYFAMTSGKIAANVIAKALENKDTSEHYLSIYQKKWKKEFGKDLKILYKARKKRRKGMNEKIYKIANFDKNLGKMIIHLGIGTYSFHKNRWKLVRRYLIASLKYRFKKSKNNIV